MSTGRLARSGLALALALLAGACKSTPEFIESGFLPDYSKMKVEDAPKGGRRLIYINPDFTPAKYDALMLEPVVFYPEPKPAAQVSAETLQAILDYWNKTLREKLSERVRIVDAPGPGVAHWRTGITAVGAETKSLEFYQYIPVALVITGAVALAQGGLPEEVKIAVEIQITDSVSHSPLLLLVRGGTGERLKSVEWGKREVAADSLKQLFDLWATNAAEQVTKYVKPL